MRALPTPSSSTATATSSTATSASRSRRPTRKRQIAAKIATAINSVSWIPPGLSPLTPTRKVGGLDATATVSAADNTVVDVDGPTVTIDLGTSKLLSTLQDNKAYEIGTDQSGAALSDGKKLEVPKGVTLMFDAGAVVKLRGANVDVGSSAQNIDRSLGSVQVLGVPGESVYFTSYWNAAPRHDHRHQPVGPGGGGRRLGRTRLPQQLRLPGTGHRSQPAGSRTTRHLPRLRQPCRHQLRRRQGDRQRRAERLRPDRHDRGPPHRLLQHDHAQRRRRHVGRPRTASKNRRSTIGSARRSTRTTTAASGPTSTATRAKQQHQRPVPARRHQCRAVARESRACPPASTTSTSSWRFPRTS